MDDGAPPFDALQQIYESVHIRHVVQGVVDGLAYERVVRDFTDAGHVFGARVLVGKHDRSEVFGLHALDGRGHLAPGRPTRHRQRHVGVPAPADGEDGRVQQGLGQHVARGPAVQVRRDFVEVEAVRLPERQHDGVFGGRGLQLEVEPPAEPLAQGQAPGAVDPPAERAVDDELHPARLVEETFDDRAVRGRHRPQRGLTRGQILHELARRGGRQTDLIADPAGDRLDRGRGVCRLGCFTDSPADRRPQARHRGRQRRAACGRLTQPERHGRRLPAGVLHADTVELDPQNAPRMQAELEDVAGQALDGEVFVHGADGRAARLQDDAVVGVLRDGAGVEQRGHARPAARPQPAVHAVPMHERAPPPAARGEAGRQHVHDGLERCGIQVAVRPRAAQQVEQGAGLPLAAGHFAHDVLGQHVQRLLDRGRAVQLATADRVHQRGALDQVVAAERKQAALGRRLDAVAGAAHALQEGGHRARRTELADEVHVADVDAEFERGGRDQDGQRAGLEPLFGLPAPLARQAAVVRGDRTVAQPLGQRECGPLDQAAGVGEHERRAVGARQFRDPVVHLGPHFGRHDRFERRGRHLQRQIARAMKPLVDDRARGVAPADQEAGDQIHRPLGGGQADAPQPAGARVRGQGFEPFERQGQMGAALVARHRVDLVHDHGVRARQRGAARLAAEQDVERLRGGDQDVGRLACHGLPVGRRRIAGAHHAADGRGRRAQPVRPFGDAAQRRFQVALYVVG